MQEVMRHAAWIGAATAFAIGLYFALFRGREDFVRELEAWLTPGFMNCLRGMCSLNLDPHWRVRMLIGGAAMFGLLAAAVAGFLRDG